MEEKFSNIFDNETLLGLYSSNKKIFYIRKYPKYKTLFNQNLTLENSNEIENKKKLLKSLLNENNKDSNFSKLEELNNLSEILQIIHKTEENKENEENEESEEK